MTLHLLHGARVYFIAICGTGMSALASLMKQRGYDVRGSDTAAYPPVGDFLKEQEIPVDLGTDVERIQDFHPDYVVIGNFVRRDHPQAVWVLGKAIPYGSFPSTLENLFLNQTRNFVVVGTHGKSTTTTCLAHLLEKGGRHPSFLIGGIPHDFPVSARFTGAEDFVIEGDEYDTAFFDKGSKFLHYRPHVALMMSLEWDHADIFPNPEAMEKMFRRFVHLVDPLKGKIFYCRDWSRLHDLILEEKPQAPCHSFGFSEKADYSITDYRDGPQGLFFRFEGLEVHNAMSGRFNAQNFAAALLAGREAGLSRDQLREGLQSFRGLRRRQEVRGRVREHLVIDDFAHHPTAVSEVLRGMRSSYPDHHIVVFFEPRSNTSRRAVLQEKFDDAFDGADSVFLAPVFRAEALHEGDRLNVPRIVQRLREKKRDAWGPVTVDDMVDHAQRLAKMKACAFVVLSNGSFEGLHERLLSVLKKD